MNTMKKLIATTMLCLALSTPWVMAQSDVEINIKHKKADYWIEVADKNCGATSNKINSYGTHYVWNGSADAKTRAIMGEGASEVGAACKNFRGGDAEGWRLPTASEVRFMMNRFELSSNHAVLRAERGDKTGFAYFPFAGYKESADAGLHYVNEAGAYWTSDGNKKSKYASILFLTSEYPNNSMQLKTFALSARCVRTVK